MVVKEFTKKQAYQCIQNLLKVETRGQALKELSLKGNTIAGLATMLWLSPSTITILTQVKFKKLFSELKKKTVY